MGFNLSKFTLRVLSVSVLLILSLFFIISKQNSKTEEIESAINAGKTFLCKIQRNDGAICDTLNPLFDIWETALAATALNTLDKDSNTFAFSKAMSFLRNNENADGLICHNKKCREAYCLETTSIYFQLLIEMGEQENLGSKISKITDMQLSSGKWLIGNPDVKNKMDFPSVTAFTLNLLMKAKTEPKYSTEAMNWLLSHQHDEGHWGRAWEYYDIPAYALWQIMETLSIHSNYHGVESSKNKAIKYILSQQRYNGRWEYDSSSKFRKPSNVLQTALMLCALQKAGYSYKEKAMLKAVNFLMASIKKDGSWDGGYFPIENALYKKHEYVFATSMTIYVLSYYLESLLAKK